jgi:hypothetical protein
MEANSEDKKTQRRNMNQNASAGTLYGLGFIGALVFYLQTATSVWGGVLGLGKAIFWPAILIYKLLFFLQAQ